MTIYIVTHYLKRVTSGTLLSGSLATLSLIKSARKFVLFVSATRAYSKSLTAEVERGMKGADGALEQLKHHPVRRCITAC